MEVELEDATFIYTTTCLHCTKAKDSKTVKSMKHILTNNSESKISFFLSTWANVALRHFPLVISIYLGAKLEFYLHLWPIDGLVQWPCNWMIVEFSLNTGRKKNSTG